MYQTIIKTIIISLLFFAIPRFVSAQSGQSERYQLEFGQFTQLFAPAGNTAPAPKQIQSALPNSFDPLVQTGFPYITTTDPFSFSITPLKLDLRDLTPDTPISTDATITIDVGSTTGYQVFISQDSPLTAGRGATIPDITCDDGKQSCTPQRANTWNKRHRPGFGYSVSGDDIAYDFKNSTYFRPFSLLSDTGWARIMTGSAVSGTRKATLTYKAVVSDDQPSGVYTNTINIVAVPRY